MSFPKKTLDLSGDPPPNQKQRKEKPRLPIRSTTTPSTPMGLGLVTPSPVSVAPTPLTPQQVEQKPIITVDLEKLSVEDKTYDFTADDLVEVCHVGDGNYATVSKMVFKTTGKAMAVKKIPYRDLKTTDRHEIIELSDAMKLGACPHIVKFYGFLIRDGDVWICMELLETSMDKLADRVYRKLNQRIPEEILGKMAVSVIRALDYLKVALKIIHRDVKPSNILVDKKGQFKLCDFGISGKLVDSIAITMEVGCRPYMAPERIDPQKAEHGYKVQSDVWSLGITLHELALGTFPYGKWNTIFEQLNAVVNGPPPMLPDDGRFSKELRDICSACLIKDEVERPNYNQLMGYAFFKNYDKMDVNVASWMAAVQATAAT